MALQKLDAILGGKVRALEDSGASKGPEAVITGITPAKGPFGPRYHLSGNGQAPFIRMNANAYLGLSTHPAVVSAEEAAVRRFGTGPGAVRFISGTFAPHADLEMRLAAFHGREAAMLYSSAYATVMGVLSSLIDAGTAVVSDALNHNCIINAIRLSRPAEKKVYPHLDMAALENCLEELKGRVRRVMIITDGVFSMRGDHAPMDRVCALAERYDPSFPEGVITVMDDSHGIGAFGVTGRGTEEVTGAAGRVDILIATLGKALGVNGGYVASSAAVIRFLRETAPFYIYSNPISPAEAAAAAAALDILDSPEGVRRIEHLRTLTRRFEGGLIRLGFEVISGDHPVVPLMVRDTVQTARLTAYLRENRILATGLGYPVVPKGDEEIRFQISAEHTEADIDAVLAVLAEFTRTPSPP